MEGSLVGDPCSGLTKEASDQKRKKNIRAGLSEGEGREEQCPSKAG